MLGLTGILFTWPLWAFLGTLPDKITIGKLSEKTTLRTFFGLFRNPSLRVVTTFVAIGTFGLFLVYTWLPTFLYDKFALGMARAGFEASVFPQIGTASGLLLGGVLADYGSRRTKASRFWVASVGFLLGAPCIFCIGAATTVADALVDSFGFFIGQIGNLPRAFSRTGVLSRIGCRVLNLVFSGVGFRATWRAEPQNHRRYRRHFHGSALHLRRSGPSTDSPLLDADYRLARRAPAPANSSAAQFRTKQ